MTTLADEWGEDPGDRRKRHPLDFVLWRPSQRGEPSGKLDGERPPRLAHRMQRLRP